MIRLNINLPTKRRLSVSLTKRRKSLDEPLFPDLGKVFRIRKGSRFSRFFRHIFEHTKIKRIFSTNFALLAIASSIVAPGVLGKSNIENSYEVDEVSAPVVLTTQTGIQYPVENVKITTHFSFFHPGIDLDGITGDEIKPIMAGKVVDTGYSRFGYGNSVTVSHGNEISSFYAHLSKISVSKGELVDKNTKIGEMGATGRAFGDHLHLEIHENGKPINPLTLLP
jgi:murein DD-endopeptidase MepM/ murein hydrolase activator NlpD